MNEEEDKETYLSLDEVPGEIKLKARGSARWLGIQKGDTNPNGVKGFLFINAFKTML